MQLYSANIGVGLGIVASVQLDSANIGWGGGGGSTLSTPFSASIRMG